MRHGLSIEAGNGATITKPTDTDPFLSGILKGVLWLTPALAGGYFVWPACVCTVVLLAGLLIRLFRHGSLLLPKSWTMGAAAAICAVMGLSFLWAVDSGMAPMGLAKFLPVLLFGIALRQLTEEERSSLLEQLPFVGAVMTAISLVAALVPELQSLVLVNHRLAGFFQYPNAYALYLLLGVLILLTGPCQSLCRKLALAVLMTGIYLSGSRIVMALFLLSLVGLLVGSQEKRQKQRLLLLLVGVMALGLIYGAVVYDHYFSRSLNTLWGRLLYARDALPVLVSHPLGLGYQGYAAIQGSIQTGTYTVLHVHNDFLQVFLDAGWIPGALFLLAVVLGYLNSHRRERMLLAVLCGHCLLDFDLQFLAISLVLVLILEQQDGPGLRFSGKAVATAAAVGILLISSLMGTAAGLFHFGRYREALKVYPAYTEACLRLLPQAGSPEEINALADRVLAHSEAYALAWSAKARTAMALGDFRAAAAYQEKALEQSRYTPAEYMDYFGMLAIALENYAKIGDEQGAVFCRQKLMEIPGLLKTAEAEKSWLARKLTDQPELKLPEECMVFLSQLR